MVHKDKSKPIVFTVCNLKYLDKALVLGESLYRSNKFELNIYIFDKQIKLPQLPDYIKIEWIEKIADNDFYKNAFKYDVIELTTAYKPYIAADLATKHSGKKIFFFDPDVMIFENLDEISDQLNTFDFVITPHRADIVYNPHDNLHLQRFGFFNLGFFALNPNKNSIDILNWWWKQCSQLAFNEVQSGMFTDQKWMSLSTFYFDNILILRNKSLNVSWWNLNERRINIIDNSFYVEEKPLVFYHFSAFGSKSKITNREFELGKNSNSILSKLAEVYDSNLSKYSTIKNLVSEYSFDYFNDGTYINPVLRRAYASSNLILSTDLNPFEKGKEIRSFIQRNFLESRGNSNLSFISHADRSKYSIYYKLFTKSLRLLLRVIGPNRFMALNRMMTYSSSLINYKDLWK